MEDQEKSIFIQQKDSSDDIKIQKPQKKKIFFPDRLYERFGNIYCYWNSWVLGWME